MAFATRRLLACLATAVGIAGPGISATYQVLSERVALRPLPPPGRIIDVNGCRISVMVGGEAHSYP